MKCILSFLALCFVALLPAAESPAADSSVQTVSINKMPPEIGNLPVLHNGRVKPLKVAARQTLYVLTGKSSFGLAQGSGSNMRITDSRKAPEVMLSWWTDTQSWAHLPLIEVENVPLRAHLELPGRWVSIRDLRTGKANQILTSLSTIVQQADESGQKLTDWNSLKEQSYQLSRDVPFAEAVIQGQTIRLIPLIRNQEQLQWVLQRNPEQVEPGRGWQAEIASIIRPFYSSGRADWRDAAAERLAQENVWISINDAAFNPDPALATWPDDLGLLQVAASWGQAIRTGSSDDISSQTEALKVALYKLADVEHLQGQGAGEHFPSRGTINVELFYERSHIFTWTWLIYLFGGIFAAIGVIRRRENSDEEKWPKLLKVGIALLVIGMILNIAGMWLRVIISGYAAVTNFYETFIYVALVVAALGLIFALTTRNATYVVAAAIGAALCAMVGEAMPADMGKDIERLQPVLRSKFWLWVHVKTIVASYAAFLLAWVLANGSLFRAMAKGKEVSAKTGKTIYRCLQVGVLLCVAGTILGGVWADFAWGRFWGWDPKEVWALIIILIYLIPLHLRYIGVVGPTGLAAWSIYGFGTVVFSWYGVNFLLGAGLHSYGFGSGGQHIVLPICGAQLLLTTVQLFVIKIRKKKAALAVAD